MRRGLGNHESLPATPDALTQSEVYAALFRAARAAGVDAIAEYSVRPPGATRDKAIDVVWALRVRKDDDDHRNRDVAVDDRQGGIWIPVAAFEIEGLGVYPASVSADVEKLDTLKADLDAHDLHARWNRDIPRAIILFRAGIRGGAVSPVRRWDNPNQPGTLGTNSPNLRAAAANGVPTGSSIVVFFDGEIFLPQNDSPSPIQQWIASAQHAAGVLVQAGDAFAPP